MKYEVVKTTKKRSTIFNIDNIGLVFIKLSFGYIYLSNGQLSIGEITGKEVYLKHDNYQSELASILIPGDCFLHNDSKPYLYFKINTVEYKISLNDGKISEMDQYPTHYRIVNKLIFEH
jgi:hypothetical protein